MNKTNYYTLAGAVRPTPYALHLHRPPSGGMPHIQQCQESLVFLYDSPYCNIPSNYYILNIIKTANKIIELLQHAAYNW